MRNNLPSAAAIIRKSTALGDLRLFNALVAEGL
jgi:hypothetical protein